MRITMEFFRPGEVKVLFQEGRDVHTVVVQRVKNGTWKADTESDEEKTFLGLVIPDVVMGNVITIARAYEALKRSSRTILEKLPEDVLADLSCYLD